VEPTRPWPSCSRRSPSRRDPIRDRLRAKWNSAPARAEPARMIDWAVAPFLLPKSRRIVRNRGRSCVPAPPWDPPRQATFRDFRGVIMRPRVHDGQRIGPVRAKGEAPLGRIPSVGMGASKGAYPADRAAALSGVPKSTIHYWAREEILVPSISAEKVKLWSYPDLMGLRIIYWLRRAARSRGVLCRKFARS
jgi:MerR HTH family regulatory protein